MRWRSKNCKDVFDAVNKNTGMAEKIRKPGPGPYDIQNADIMASWLGTYAKKNIPITIVGDFDADGICATAELYLALTSLGATNIRMRLPRRMSEGYGMSVNIVNEIQLGVVVTVDNGIAALEAIKEAKRKGLIVLVIDHHLPVKTKEGVVLPCADLIVDPMVNDSFLRKGRLVETTFRGYCGAGLVYKICQLMKCSSEIMDKISALAAIATIADVMPLHEDNRNIYRHGINSMYRGRMTAGTEELVKILQSENMVTETDIGFKLAPMLNAPGRLYDNGAEKALKAILESNSSQAEKKVAELIKINEERKILRDEAVNRARKIVEDNCLWGRNPLVVIDPLTKEGLVGLVAGELQEENHVSCFCFTQKEGYLKGSARGIEEDDLKAALDELNESHPDILIKYGGHKSAAGLSIAEDKIDEFSREMQKLLTPYNPPKEELLYDLEISAGEIKKKCEEIQKYVPFGQGNPHLMFCIRNFKLTPQNNVFYNLMRNDTVKFLGAGCTAIGFSMYEKYVQEGYPSELDLIGKLSYRYYMGNVTPQIEIIDMKAIPQKKAKSPLSDILTVALKNKNLA